MRIYVLIAVFFFQQQTFAQTNPAKIKRGFPITSYMVALNDTTQLLQIELPEGLKMEDKQVGIVQGVYHGNRGDTIRKGIGRCQLIKGNYYYYSTKQLSPDIKFNEGDLIYTMMPKNDIYDGQIPKLASDFILLQDVYENQLYDRYTIFYKWTKEMEDAVIDSCVADVKFTGGYFLGENPDANVVIDSGPYKGKKVFAVMMETNASMIRDFLSYVIVRPRLYAGNKWKISEVFATWLTGGAPVPL
ncbi:MAG: hypothetical protein IPP73_04685 [Chitinophagaceae bacterium]|nr:hypothetical protein [Chitinophagaceae bacterium]